MKTADLIPGMLYAIGRTSHSRHNIGRLGSRDIGMVLDNASYNTVRDSQEMVKGKRPDKYIARWIDHGVPVVFTRSTTQDAARILPQLDRSRVALRMGVQKIGRVEVYVKLCQPQDIETTWESWLVAQAASEERARAAQETRQQKVAANKALAGRLQALLPNVPHNVHTETGKVTIYDGQALAALLEQQPSASNSEVAAR